MTIRTTTTTLQERKRKGQNRAEKYREGEYTINHLENVSGNSMERGRFEYCREEGIPWVPKIDRFAQNKRQSTFSPIGWLHSIFVVKRPKYALYTSLVRKQRQEDALRAGDAVLPVPSAMFGCFALCDEALDGQHVFRDRR